MSVPALRCADLTIGYRVKGKGARIVANGLNLELNAGSFVCLLGPNGAGKSTLIRALAGLEKPLSGEIDVGGERLAGLTPRDRARRIGVVLTDSMPIGLFSADAIVALGRHPHTNWTGRLTERDRERIRWAMRAVGAEALAERMVGELSDGERQKIMIARALAQESSILFLDEPTAYLDLPRRVELMQTLRDLTRHEGLSIVLSTHDLDLALRCADELWLFGSDGAMTTGIPEALALNGSIAQVFASGELDWDAEAGSFRMHRHSGASAWIHGSGAAAAWTRRALARLGYGIAPSAEEASLSVRIEESLDRRSWTIQYGAKDLRCESIEELVTQLKLDNANED